MSRGVSPYSALYVLIFGLLLIPNYNGFKVKFHISYLDNGYGAPSGLLSSAILLTGKQHRCTGTLIARNKVLTAGHCACGDPMQKAYANLTSVFEVNQSTTQQRNIVDWDYPNVYDIPCQILDKQSSVIPEVLGGSADIAVLTTDEPFHLSDHFVDTIDLVKRYGPGADTNPAGTDVLVSGFGREKQSRTTGVLRWGRFPVKFEFIDLIM